MPAPKSIGAKALPYYGGSGQQPIGYTQGSINPRAPGAQTGNHAQLTPALGGGGIQGINGGGYTFSGANPGGWDPGYSASQVAPTYGGVTNFGGTPGVNSSANDYTDDYGNKFRYVNYGDGRGEWLQVTSTGALARPSDTTEIERRNAGTSIAGNGSGSVPLGAARSPTTTQINDAKDFNALNGYQNTLRESNNNALNDWNAISGPYGAAINDQTINSINGRNAAVAKQQQDTQNYINQLNGFYGQQQGYVNDANAADQAALGKYNGIADQQMANINALQAPEWTNYASDPNDIARQNSSYDFLSGVSGGSLDYTAAQATQTRADYQQATQTLAELYQYNSDPADIAAQQDVVNRLKADLEHGGDSQREVMEKYKSLSDPKATAQERYLAEIARRAFESQDRSNREAVQQDLAMRGLRSGGAEIAGNQAAQERLGQDRTLAELGLQANAIGRSMQALGGWGDTANALRSSDQNALGMLGNQVNAIRSMDDAVGMFNTNEANENSMFNAGQANQISMFNADAYNQNSMFNAGQANQISMFNTGQTNQAQANNQSTRLSGGIAAGNMANAIRGQNDAVGMFNTQGAQTSKQFAANFGLNKANSIAGIGNQQFGNTTQVNNNTFARNSGLTQLGVQNAGSGFNANTTTNGIVGNAGTQNLGDLSTGLNAQTGIFAVSNGLRNQEAERQRQADAEAVALRKRSTGLGGVRMS